MPEPTLSIAPGLAMPLDAVTSTFGILGVRGSGKTTAAAVLVEELLGNQIPCAIIDPTGAHWGLRSSANGKQAGYPVTIFGGEHADIPLEPGSGEMIANVLVAERIPAILDLSLLRKAQMSAWSADFLETLYRRNRQAMHLVIDEAQILAPQRTFAGSERALGAVEDVALRGRIRGLGLSLIAQRAASINKSVLTQMETLILMRTVGRPDIAAIDEWIANHADPDQGSLVKSELASLPTGAAWVWSPHFLGILQKVQVRRRATFDSSSTPKAGQARIAPAKWASIDAAALGERIAAAVEAAKESDPRALRSRIDALRRDKADLESRLERSEASRTQLHESLAAASAKQPTAPAPIPSPAIGREAVRALERARRDIDSVLASASEPASAVPAPAERPIESLPAEPPRPAARPVPPTGSGAASLPKAQRAILSALAPYFPRTRSKRQVAMLTGYAGGGGGFNNAISALRTAGYLEGQQSAMAATQAGIDALGAYEPLPTGVALLQHWLGQLPKAPRTILEVLIAAWPQALAKEEVAFRAGYEPGGGGFNNAISRLRTLELIGGPGQPLRASDDLMDQR